MPEPTNSERAMFASLALQEFAEITGQKGEDDDTNTTDLLANLIHLLGPGRFRAALCLARMHYEHEGGNMDD